MNTLEVHAQINGYLQSISTALSVLERSFKNVAPRTPLDDACIDTLTVQANALIAAAAALKQVQFEGTPQG